MSDPALAEDPTAAQAEAVPSHPDSVLKDLPPLDGPPPGIRYRRGLRFGSSIKELWQVREVMNSLTERELRGRYAQAFLGSVWVILGPLAMMIVFTVFLGRLGGVSTNGVPRPLFTYVGVLVWTFFSSAVGAGALSIVSNPLLNKVYAPREVFPISSIMVRVVDSFIASSFLLILFPLTGRWPDATSYWVVPLLAIMVVFTVAITLLLAGLTVYMRDLRHALPLILQLGLFATPVMYDGSRVFSNPELYAAINPLSAVIDGIRASMFHSQAPAAAPTLIAAAVSLVWLVIGYGSFKQMEAGFADVA